MASLSAAAIVVSHARPDLLAKTLEALATQTKLPVEVIVVETSQNLESKKVTEAFEYKFIATSNTSLNESISLGLVNLSKETAWIWIVHDDCAPQPDALKLLLQTAETSPSVAVVGPKLLDANNHNLIQQLGLTTTRAGKPFALVQEEYDQGQHDRIEDVMATSTAGMLVSLGVWKSTGGLNEDAPNLAQDLDFGIRVRAAGYRVIVEPKARVLHHALSLNGLRSKKWLGGSWATAISKSESYLATLLLPSWLATIRILLLPLIAFVSIPLHVYNKKLARIPGDFSSWVWTWVLLPKILRGRKRLRSLGRISVLQNLYASTSQIRRRKESKLEFVSYLDSNEQNGLIASGAIWAALLPLVASFSWLPSGAALKLGSEIYIAPKVDAWFATITQNAVPWFNGKFIAMDPFTWIYGFFALANPAEPSTALAWFMLLAPAIAFAGAWKLFAALSRSTLLSTLVALAYAMLVIIARTAGGIEVTIFATFLPLALWAFIRARSAETSSRTWRWVGLAGLLLAVVAVSNPALFALVIVLGLLSSIRQPKKLFIPVVIGLPGTMLLLPYLTKTSDWKNWFFSFENAAFQSQENLLQFFVFLIAPILLLAVLGIFRKPPATTLAVAGFGLASYLLALLVPSNALQQMFLIATFLSLGQLAIYALDESKKNWLIPTISLPAFAWVAILSIWTQLGVKVEYAEPRNVPALIAAAYDTGEEVRTLEIELQEEQVLSHLLIGDGKQLHEKSFLALITPLPDSDYQELLSSIAARVVALNPEGLEEKLAEAKIDFLLIRRSESGTELSVASGLTSVSFLQAAGQTEFGNLFRVVGSNSSRAASKHSAGWITWQLGLLGSFVLLAIPTPAAIAGSRRKSTELQGEEQ